MYRLVRVGFVSPSCYLTARILRDVQWSGWFAFGAVVIVVRGRWRLVSNQ